MWIGGRIFQADGRVEAARRKARGAHRAQGAARLFNAAAVAPAHEFAQSLREIQERQSIELGCGEVGHIATEPLPLLHQLRHCKPAKGESTFDEPAPRLL